MPTYDLKDLNIGKLSFGWLIIKSLGWRYDILYLFLETIWEINFLGKSLKYPPPSGGILKRPRPNNEIGNSKILNLSFMFKTVGEEISKLEMPPWDLKAGKIEESTVIPNLFKASK